MKVIVPYLCLIVSAFRIFFLTFLMSAMFIGESIIKYHSVLFYYQQSALLWSKSYQIFLNTSLLHLEPPIVLKITLLTEQMIQQL